ncbi:RNA recognition motif. (a.k.a. RRM, RBD, or RNP domain), putative [Leishmania shawi]|uniref:RNA recognition motif (RRM, RBD, or RNP domain) n=1 Tax=Leishmania shawi TaxID=5680 RepID=A0ABR3E6F8_9TRYP
MHVRMCVCVRVHHSPALLSHYTETHINTPKVPKCIGAQIPIMASFTPLDNFKSRSRGMLPTGIVIDKSCRVYVTQIPLERIERDGTSALKAEFEVYGPLESYKMFTDRSGRFIGSALCTYRNPADASMAVYCMDGVEMEGSKLHVEPAKEHGVVLLSSGSSGGGNGPHRDHSRGFLPDTQRQWGRGGRGGTGLFGAGRGRGDSSTGGRDVSNALQSDPQTEELGLVATDDVFPSEDSGKWSHDKYQMMAEGKDMDEVLGIRRPHHRGGARGRSGRAGQRYGERVDAAFERYIHERNSNSEDALLPLHPSYTTAASSLSIQTDVQPTPETEPAAERSVAETMAEMAFGADESDAPVTGLELGALQEDA